jgi:AraC-like DNA-binding protein
MGARQYAAERRVTPKQIVDEFRDLAHDNATPPHWSTTSLLRYLNEARMQAARRARLLEDASTAEVCKLAVKAGKDIYDIDSRVLYIRRVKLATKERPLPKLSTQDADAFQPGWESNTSGDVVAWMPWGLHKLRLVDKPTADDTINMIVVREPLEDVTLTSDEEAMEIERRYHYGLVDWMMARAYMERDLIEKYRPEEAADRMAMFEREFGPPAAAALEVWTHRKHGYDDYEGLF